MRRRAVWFVTVALASVALLLPGTAPPDPPSPMTHVTVGARSRSSSSVCRSGAVVAVAPNARRWVADRLPASKDEGMQVSPILA